MFRVRITVIYRLRISLLVFLILGLAACKGNPGPASGPRIGSRALDFSLKDTKDQTWTLANVKGKVVLLRFWADWCPSCRFEMPVIEKQFQRLTPQGFQVLAVNVKQSAQVAEAFAAQMNITFPILLDTEGQLAKKYGVYAIPTNFLIDQQGVIREILIGEVFREEKPLRQLLQTFFPG
ncbi:MAG: thiol-disulfide oxidoreductase [Desulfobacca sp.]|nr:thiol-disulfide oxidoreductase [Desulfobacca sp.]